MAHPKYPNCTHCLPNRLCHEHTRAEDAKIRAEMERAEMERASKPDGFVWEDPPTPTAARKEAEYGAALDTLMKHPKRWARIRAFPSASAANTAAVAMRKSALRPGKWEYRGVSDGQGGSRLYARYLGEGD